MIFRNFPEGLLGSKVKVKILRYMLAENLPSSATQMAHTMGVSHTAVIGAMNELSGMNIIQPAGRVGKTILWKLNVKHYAYDRIKSFVGIKTPAEDLKEFLISALSGIKIEKAVIYGSVAAGMEKANSDIDLFVVAADETNRKKAAEKLEDAAADCLGRYGNRLSYTVINKAESECRANAKIKEFGSQGISVI